MLQNVILNEAEVLKTWSGFITESTGVTDRAKLTWMSKYCAYHDMNEKQSLNESALGYAHLNPNMNVGGMGAAYFPGANPNNGYDGVRGSGDNPFSLLPLAVQVAAQTIALDLVPVVPMQGPLGILQYMDYVYEGGKTNFRPRFEGADESKTAPLMVKLTLSAGDANSDSDIENALKSDAALVNEDAINHALKFKDLQKAFVPHMDPIAVGDYDLIFVALGRIDGRPIFQVKEKAYYAGLGKVNGGEGAAASLAETLLVDEPVITGKDGSKFYVVDIDTVKALEDFIPGFSGNGFKNGDPMSAKAYDRETGESTPSNMMSLNTFTLSVKAKTIQVKGAITREQIQDLKAYGIDAVAQVEAELVNELTQHINRELLDEIFALGDQNHVEAEAFEGINLNTYFTVRPDDAAPEGYISSYVGGGAETLGTIQRRIMSKVLAASNLIAQRGRRGAGTFAVCSAAIATALQDCAGFVAYPLSNTINQNAGSLYPVGAISGVSIYVDPNLPWSATKIVVGRKGKDNEPGLVFMPYLMADKLSYPAEGMEGAPVTSLKSRYALVRAGHHPQLYYYSFDIKLGEGVSLY
jgi:hypothetical protein